MQIVSTCLARDIKVYSATHRSLQEHIPACETHLITRKENFQKFRAICGTGLVLWDEREIVPGMNLEELRKFPLPWFPAGAGWYFQQFLKLSFERVSNADRHFMIWDADTVLLRPIEFFDRSDRPIYTRAEENHLPYFETFAALFGTPANREFSFISQHQVIDKQILREMFRTLETNHPESRNWAWAVMENLRGKGTNLFSEYETYGHFMKWRHPGSFSVRDLAWTRHGGGSLSLPPWRPVLRKLARQYDFAAFEASDGIRRRLLKQLRQFARRHK